MDDINDAVVLDPAGFISIRNKPTIDELAKFYNELYFQDGSLRPKNYQEEYDEKEMQHIKLMNDLCLYSLLKARPHWKKKPGSMLEVGVGEGFMMSRAEHYGWNVRGIDFSSYGIKKFNPKILNKVDIGNAFDLLNNLQKQAKKFDVCMIHNVLEHIIDPRKLLETLRVLLTDNGIIVLTVPNDFSKTQMRAYDLGHIKKKFWVTAPQHLHYFNTSNIRTFMEEMGFQIVDMYSSFPIDFYLFHPGSNYVRDDKNGKPAHRARIEIDLLMADGGLENYHRLCQSFSSCHVGRDITVLVKRK